MEAKDIVMSDEQIAEAMLRGCNYDENVNPLDLIKDGYLHDGHRSIAKAQAEVSFKAGIRKVIEWVEEKFMSYDIEDRLGGKMLWHFLRICDKEWQSFKKSIEEEK